MKNPDVEKYLPESWTDEDKIQYEIYIAEAKRIYSKMDDYIIHFGVMAYINQQKGLTKEEVTPEEVQECMNKYDMTSNKNIVIETPFDENFKMEDTLKPIIYCDS